MGPNNWGIFLILFVTTGEGIGPAGEIFPVVCMLKNGLPYPDIIQNATGYMGGLSERKTREIRTIMTGEISSKQIESSHGRKSMLQTPNSNCWCFGDLDVQKPTEA